MLVKENTVCFHSQNIRLHMKMDVQTHSIHISCTDQSREMLINKENSVETVVDCPREPRGLSFPPEFHKAQNNDQSSRIYRTETNCSEISLHVPLSSSSGRAGQEACLSFAIFIFISTISFFLFLLFLFFIYSYLHSLLYTNVFFRESGA